MKNIKSTLAITLTTVIALGSLGLFFGCNSQAFETTKAVTQAATQQTATEKTKVTEKNTNSEKTVKSATNAQDTTKAEDNTKLYNKLVSLVSKKGATGYTCCKIAGSKNYFLVVSYGSAEAERMYKVYKINAGNVKYAGELGGAHTVAYIDANSTTIGLMNAHMGNWAYGLVKISDGKLFCDYNHEGIAKENEDYPSLPGEQIQFSKTTYTAPLENFM